MTLTMHSEKFSPTPLSRPPAPQVAEPDQNPHPSATTSVVRIVLADSQAIYRVGMKKVFALEDDIRVVAQAESLPNLHSALQRYPTDVVLLEGQMIAGTIDAIPELMKHAPNAKLIVQV